jgi:hypothetical protein
MMAKDALYRAAYAFYGTMLWKELQDTELLARRKEKQLSLLDPQRFVIVLALPVVNSPRCGVCGYGG